MRSQQQKRNNHFHVIFFLVIAQWLTATIRTDAQGSVGRNKEVTIIPVDTGWASNSVNTTVFRKNSLVSFRDTQFIAFYNSSKYVVLGKRKLGEAKWQLKVTTLKGNASDAHNIISIMADGDGYMHVAWDHHNNSLHYAKSAYPGALDMIVQNGMTGAREKKVSYPEFYKMNDGGLLFIYRDGGSGNGNMVLNRYDLALKKWAVLQPNLIDGEGKRNAYWQACIDARGTIHVSWVWRESPDVASNHDLCYARSNDGGITWEKSTDEKYTVPITAASAEIACAIPQKSELINQTSMTADKDGTPFIATYWRSNNSNVPQYRLVYKNAKGWQANDLGFRNTAFSLSGAGTKRIPVSRPQVVVKQQAGKTSVAIIFRDEERGNKVSVAVCSNITKGQWKLSDLDDSDVGSWEPTFDTGLYKEKGLLHLFIQKTNQADAEGQSAMAPQIVKVLEWMPRF